MTNTLDLRLSTDRKTANSVTPNGKTPRFGNAFGLLAGRDNSCPGQTSACESVCYAGKLEKLFPAFGKVMTANLDAVKDAAPMDIFDSLDHLLTEFERKCEKWDAPKAFRIHHDGDFFSVEYASAWRSVIESHPDVQFWAYTRSFTDSVNVVPILAELPNLSLYLSVDTDNAEMAKGILSQYPTVKAATLTDTFANGTVMMKELGRDKVGAACPELKGALPLIDKKGGACITCNLCPMGKADIRFASKGK
jgi:hypothetical protein